MQRLLMRNVCSCASRAAQSARTAAMCRLGLCVLSQVAAVDWGGRSRWPLVELAAVSLSTTRTPPRPLRRSSRRSKLLAATDWPCRCGTTPSFSATLWHNIRWRQADVSTPDGVSALFMTTAAAYADPVSVLVNNVRLHTNACGRLPLALA